MWHALKLFYFVHLHLRMHRIKADINENSTNIIAAHGHCACVIL